MLRKLFTTLSIIASVSLMHAQNESAIKIKLTDKANKETIPFANVVVEMGGIQVGVGTTNIDGEVMIKPLNPGKYNVKATYVGYQPFQIENVTVPVGKTVYLNMEMSVGAGQQLDVVEVVEYSVPLIDPDTKSGATVTREEYQNMASKNVNSVAATSAGVYQQDEGGALNVRGARSTGTAYYVDGQKVIGSAGVPQSSVEQISTIVGGTPAEYGDATGGIISITTRGPASKYSGSVEVVSSGAGEKKGLDSYGYNFIGFSINGPILIKKDSVTSVKKSVLGFSIGGEATSVKDPDPLAGGTYRIKKDKLAELEENPLKASPLGNGFVFNSEYVTMDDIEKVKARQNVASNGIVLNGKVQYQPTTNLGITVGGSVNYGKRHDYTYVYSLFNPVNNPQVITSTWRAYAKLTQKFNSATTKEEEKSSSVIKNAYFTIQASFAKNKTITQDDSHKDNFFDYGYIGKFNQAKINSYNLETRDKYDFNGDGIKDTVTAIFLDGFQDAGLTFTPGDKNPTGTNYTKQFYALHPGEAPVNGLTVQSGHGLLNGDNAGDVYSIWRNTGRQYPTYDKFDQTQFRVFANFSADIKKHAIQVGFEYEQRAVREFTLAPVGLWTRMRELANSHLTQLDSVPIYVATDPTTGFSVYDFNRRNDGTQTQFDKSLREKLGKNVNGTDWIDIDSYDPSTFTLDMFSADDLLNRGGGSYVNYYGYDQTGKKLSGKPSLDDFYTKKDANGNYTREIGAYQPIYIAGYIQDKFDFKDLKFNVGLRVDRFDANQKVLKDKYLLYEAKTANEVNYTQFNTTRPSNIGDDYVVYVDDKNNPGKILGYRNEDTWYNAQGTEVEAVTLTGNTIDSHINPYLVDPAAAKAKTINPKVFTDYVPQISVMPRIAFAFPISDEANFFAHYDVLTQRPADFNTRLDPLQYLNIESATVGYVKNPNLKPEKTVDYELGFTQVLNEKKNSAITLSTFYRELRDMLQTTVVNQAYPVTYKSFTNVDFGTVKGFSIAYDLRRMATGVRFTASYTLQFADGTGSNAADGASLTNAGLPNLRVTHPLDYDQRHVIKFNVDYRFGGGKDYKGPALTLKKGSEKEKTIKMLENVGANLQFQAGSGTPYTRQSNVTQDVAIGIAQNSILKGDVNGSNLPWTYRMDLRIDKDLELSWGKEGDDKKHANLNIYLQVLNLLNTKNIKFVYRYTGNPDDDGYLDSPNGQVAVASKNSAASFTDLYRVAVNDPNNYSQARVIRLGLLFEF